MAETEEDEYHNGFRIMKLLDEAASTLQNQLVIFYQNDVTKLETDLDKNKDHLRKAVQKKQMEILFPCDTHTHTDPRKYDISLLYVLFRVLKIVKKPTTGWYNQPLERDISKGAALVRIHNSRNSLYHGRLRKTHTEFNKYLHDIGNSMMKFGCDIKIINDIINMKTNKNAKELLKDKDDELRDLHQEYEKVLQKLADLDRCFEDEVWFDVQPLIPSFTGRKEEVKLLHNSMQNLGNGIVATVLTGLPGTGKSTLIQYYCYEYHQYYHSNVIWIDASTEEKLKYSFTKLAKHLNINECNDVGVLVTHIYKMFKKTNVLFVFDNAQDEESIGKYMPFKLPPNANSPAILLTSQKSNWGQNFHEINIPKLSIDESVEFIKSKIPESLVTKESDVNELASEIDGYPLALQQSVAYINHFAITVNEFLSKFRSMNMTASPSLLCFPSGDTHYKNQFSASLEMILDKLSGTDSREVMGILMLTVILDCSRIDARIFENYLQEIGDPNEKILQELEELSLIKITANYFEKCRVISMHSLVQKFIRQKFVNSDNVDSCIRKLFHLLRKFILQDRKDFKAGDPAFGSIWLHHCVNFYEILRHNLVLINELAGWKREIVTALSYRGNEVLAIEMIWCLKNHYEQLFGKNNKQILDCLFLLQKCYISLRRWEEGLEVCTHAEDMATTLFQPGNEDASTAKHNRALCLSRLGKTNEALSIYKDLFSSNQISGIYSDSTLITGLNLSSELLRSKRHREALELQDILLDAIRKFSTFQRKNTYYDIWERKVMTILDLGKKDEAISLISHSIEECTVNLGKENLKTLELKNTLGYCLVMRSKYQDGIEILKENLEQTKKMFGHNHPKYTDVLCMLASCYSNVGETDKALEIYLERKHFVEEQMGCEHIEVSEIDKNIARCYFYQGKYKDSIGILSSVLAKETSLYGENHQMLIRTKAMLAYHHYMIGDYKKALNIHEELKKCVEEAHGKQHVDVYSHMNWIALCMEKIGLLNESLRIHENITDHLETNYVENFDLCLGNRFNKAICLLAMGNIQDAFDTFEKEVLRTKSFNDLPSFFAMYYLGTTYVSMNNLIHARNTLKECLVLGEKLFSKHHVFNLRIHYQMTRCDFSEEQNVSTVKDKCQYILEKADNLIPSHLTVVATKILLGQCYLKEKNSQMAIGHCQDAIESSKNILDKNHPIFKIAYDILNTK